MNKDISNDVEIWYYTSNYYENDKGPLLIGKNINVNGLLFFIDELGGRIMTSFAHSEQKHIQI